MNRPSQSANVEGHVRTKAQSDYERRKQYCVDFVRSYGLFLDHDEQLWMYSVLLEAMRWGESVSLPHDVDTSDSLDAEHCHAVQEEVVYV